MIELSLFIIPTILIMIFFRDKHSLLSSMIYFVSYFIFIYANKAFFHRDLTIEQYILNHFEVLIILAFAIIYYSTGRLKNINILNIVIQLIFAKLSNIYFIIRSLINSLSRKTSHFSFFVLFVLSALSMYVTGSIEMIEIEWLKLPIILIGIVYLLCVINELRKEDVVTNNLSLIVDVIAINSILSYFESNTYFIVWFLWAILIVFILISKELALITNLLFMALYLSVNIFFEDRGYDIKALQAFLISIACSVPILKDVSDKWVKRIIATLIGLAFISISFNLKIENWNTFSIVIILIAYSLSSFHLISKEEQSV